MRNNITELIELLMNYFNVSTMQELAKKLDIKQSSLSSWKSRNSINAVKKKCRELGIYNEIFGDFKETTSNNNKESISGNEKEFTFYFDKILSNYNVPTLKDLSEVTSIPISTLSSIKQRHSITALIKKCRELGIYNEIFGDLDSTKEIKDNSVSSIDTELFSKDTQRLLNIVSTTICDDENLKDKFHDMLKNFVKESL